MNSNERVKRANKRSFAATLELYLHRIIYLHRITPQTLLTGRQIIYLESVWGYSYRPQPLINVIQGLLLWAELSFKIVGLNVGSVLG
jgi:hypothetical protein